MSTHTFQPEPGYETECKVCSLPERNRVHQVAAQTAPLPNPTRDTVHIAFGASANSVAAGLRAHPKSGTIKAQLLVTISGVDPRRGVTDKELEQQHPTIGTNSLRPRRVDLLHDGWLEPVRDDLGHEVTRGGYTAWRLSPAGRAQWRGEAA